MMQGVTKPGRLYRLDVNLWSAGPKANNSTAGAASTSAAGGEVEPDRNSSEACAVLDVASTSAASPRAEAAHAGAHFHRPMHASVRYIFVDGKQQTLHTLS
jgi:hypothetical protein